MNRERELLQHALVALENYRRFISDWGGYATEYFQKKHDLEGDISAHDVLMREIKAELEKPEQEPVAWFIHSTNVITTNKERIEGLKNITPLYTSPQQKSH